MENIKLVHMALVSFGICVLIVWLVLGRLTSIWIRARSSGCRITFMQDIKVKKQKVGMNLK